MFLLTRTLYTSLCLICTCRYLVWYFTRLYGPEVRSKGTRVPRVQFGLSTVRRLSDKTLKLKEAVLECQSHKLIGQGLRIYEVTLCLPSGSPDGERGLRLRGHEHFNDVPHANMAICGQTASKWQLRGTVAARHRARLGAFCSLSSWLRNFRVARFGCQIHRRKGEDCRL